MMQNMFAERLSRISASPTMKVLVEAERLRQQGVDVIDFGAGEPDFTTPDSIKAAGRAAIDQDFTRYTPAAGTRDLVRAILSRYERDYGLRYAEDEVIVTAGGKQALFNIALALFDHGDEIITHAPGWNTIVEQIKLTGASPVIVRAYLENGFALAADDFLRAITPRTRAIMINSPCNPTGVLMSETALGEIIDGVAERDIWIILDLCYEQLIYEPAPHNLPGLLMARLRDRSVFAGSASKSYAMTGWRCGWALGPSSLISACAALQSHSTSNASSISQRAALAALTGDQDCVARMREQYKRRRDTLIELLASERRLRSCRPMGAFYLFVDIGDLLLPSGVRTSAQFAQALLNEAHVAVTAGEAFDSPGFIRISFATSMEQIREGVARIMRFIGTLENRATSQARASDPPPVSSSA